MQPANTIKACSNLVVLAALLVACKPLSALSTHTSQALAGTAHSALLTNPIRASLTDALVKPTANQPVVRNKTGSVQGDFVGPAIDCDGDGFSDETRIDFDGDGAGDECVEAAEDIPEPPFQQTYTPTADSFYALLPVVGWDAQYQCDDGLYEVTLRRPSESTVEYIADGLILSSPIIYDDTDPNLNQPLIIQDPEEGVRYSFHQESNGEFYEYALSDYGGEVGLYIYQTGEQIVAAPCEPVAGSSAGLTSETLMPPSRRRP